MSIPMPLTVQTLAPITEALNAATAAQRLAWSRSLNGKQQYHLYDLAAGSGTSFDSLGITTDRIVIGSGRNGLALFNLFEKRFAKINNEVVGYNYNEFPGWITRWITGPGHFRAYESPDVPGELWIDYRTIPEQTHPDFPPLASNEHGIPALVFGNMVDIVRKVSDHVLIGDAFKNLPRSTKAPLLARIGSLFATAPFVLVVESEEQS